MTCEYFNINPDDALYNVARSYPGNIEALALRLGRQASVLRKQMAPGTTTHHLSPDDFLRIIELCAEARVPEAFAPLHAMAFRLDHVAVRMPAVDADADSGELFQQILLMLREEGELAKCIQDSLAENSAGGKKIAKNELAIIENHLEQCIGALATLREQVRAKHRKDAGN
jgi:hypothetical protein